MFLLTRPMRDVTSNDISDRNINTVSTHTPHAGRDATTAAMTPATIVSTHTPHAGRDVESECPRPVNAVSTHTPHAGRDF